MTVAIITDTHFGVRGESEAFSEIQKKMLNDFFAFCSENSIKEIWHAGDLFDDRKKISSKLLSFVNENWVNKVSELGIKVKIIVGNHDTFFKNTNKINSVSEILSKDSNHTVVVDDILEFNYNNKSVAFVPWICPENSSSIIQKLTKNYYDVVVGHFDIAGMLMQGSVVSEHGMSKSDFKNHGLVLSGHYHKKSMDGNIHYLGNPLPTNWAEAQDPHGWHTFNGDLNSLTFHEWKHPIYQRLVVNTKDKISFDWDGSIFLRILIKNKNEFHYQNLLNELKNYDIKHISIIDDTIDTQEVDNDLINEEELRDDLVVMLKEYVKKTQDEKHIQKLLDLFDKLYQEKK
jgi:DNA repair exonuclease SbcCD nuclease subunit